MRRVGPCSTGRRMTAKLLLKKYVSITESYLYVLDIASGQVRELDPPRPR